MSEQKNIIICPNCEHPNDSSNRLCERCNTPFLVTKPITELPPSQQPQLELDQTSHAGQALTGTTLVLNITGYAKPLYVRRQPEIVLGRSAPGETPPTVDLRKYRGQLMGISRRHAAIRCEPKSCALEDLASVNGTFLNEKKLSAHEPQPLKVGDQIRLGHLNMTIASTSIDSIVLTHSGDDTISGLNPIFLTETLGPYLRALSDLQTIINSLTERSGAAEATIHSISPGPGGGLNIRLSEASDAAEILNSHIMPWRRRYGQVVQQMQHAHDDQSAKTRFLNAQTLLIQEIVRQIAPDRSADTLGEIQPKMREALDVLLSSALELSQVTAGTEEDDLGEGGSAKTIKVD